MLRHITDDIVYIGSDDLDIDLFESQYIVPEGMAYNSYLIKDEKTAVMDTSDWRKGEQWKKNLLEALEGRSPDYLVVHHMEPDHSALAAWALSEWPSLKIVASAKAIQMFGQFFDGVSLEGRSIAVKEGDTLPLGKHCLAFKAAPMVHWPEVMVSFDTLDKVLFSADGFGKFGALSKCGFFADEDDDWACEARRYYFNICGKYGAQVQALLKKAGALAPEIICPLHGPIIRKELGYYIGLYDIWSRYAVESEGIFIAYASIHGGTAAAALKLREILLAKGAPKVAITDLSREDQAEAVEDAFRYGTTVFAAASYDAGVFPPMDIFLHHLRDKGWQKRRAAILENGSWAPSAGRVIRENLSNMKDITVLEPSVTIHSRLSTADFPALEALAESILNQ